MTCIIRIFCLVVIGSVLLVSGCVAKREQFVNNQIYTCTVAPTLRAEVREDLKFIGLKENAQKVLTGPDFAGGVKTETFLFGASENGKITKALFFISETMLELDAYFIDSGCEGVDQDAYYFNGYITEDYTRQCRLVYLVTWNYANGLMDNDHSQMQNLVFSGRYLAHSQSRVTYGDKTFFDIIYLESIPYDKNSGWKARNVDSLSREEREIYHRFLENAKTAFKKIN